MSSDDDNISILMGLDEDADYTPQVDSMVMGQLELALNKFNGEFKELEQICENVKDMKKIGEFKSIILRIKQIFKNDKREIFSIADKDLVYKTICIIVNTISGLKIDDNDRFHSSDTTDTSDRSIKAIKDQLEETQKQAAKYQNQFNTAQRELNALKSENETLKQDIEENYNKNQELIKKINDIRRQADREKLSLMKEIDTSSTELQDVKSKLLQIESANARLTKQLEISGDENSELTKEIALVKSKLESKREKNESMEGEVTDLQVKISSLESEKDLLANEVLVLKTTISEQSAILSDSNSQNYIKLKNEFNDISNLNRNLSELVEHHSEEYVELVQRVKKLKDLVKRQLEIVNYYDQIATRSVSKSEKLQNEVNKLNEELNMLKYKDSDDDNFLPGRYGSVLQKIKKLIDERSGSQNDPENLPDLIEDLILGASNSELIDQNFRLFDIIENQLRFISNLASSGDIKFLLLKPDGQEEVDEAFKDTILVEIARARQFITQNGQKCDIGDKNARDFLLNMPKNNPLVREAYITIASQAINCEVVRKIGEKSQASYSSMLSELLSVAHIVNFEGNNSKIASFIAEKLRKFRIFAKKVHDTIVDDDDFNYEDFDSTIEYIAKYLHVAGSIMRQVDTDLRNTLRFDGDISEIPFQARSRIDELNNSVSAISEHSVEEMQHRLDEERSLREIEKTNNANKVNQLRATIKKITNEKDRLEDTITTMEQQIRELSNQKSEINKKKVEFESRLQKMIINYKDIENDLANAKAESEALRKDIESRKEKFKERLEMITGEEKEAHRVDLQRMERRYMVKEQKIKDELDSKKKKINELKQRISTIKEQYEEELKKQREVSNEILKHNKMLIEKMNNQELPDHFSDRKLEKLQAEIKSLTAEKQMLQHKVMEAQDNSNKIAQFKDSFWREELSMRENELTRVLTEEADEIREQFANFVDSIVKSFSEFVNDKGPRNSFNSSDTNSVLEMVRNTCAKFRLLEQDNTKTSADKSSELKKAVQDMRALNEWDRWARDLFVSVTSGELPAQGSRELRFLISEMALSSISHRRLLYRLESLRYQKNLLKTGIVTDPNKPLTIGVVISTVKSVIRMLIKSGHSTNSVTRRLLSSSHFM